MKTGPNVVATDNELIRPNLNPDDMGVDKDCVLDLSGLTEVISNGIGDEGFDLSCRNPADGAGLLGPSLRQSRREVVPVLDGPFADMARAHPVAAIINDAAQQEGL